MYFGASSLYEFMSDISQVAKRTGAGVKKE
jgi:hypothetical protein